MRILVWVHQCISRIMIVIYINKCLNNDNDGINFCLPSNVGCLAEGFTSISGTDENCSFLAEIIENVESFNIILLKFHLPTSNYYLLVYN